MVTISCPWCDEAQSLSLIDVVGLEEAFTCPDCGTSVAVVTETGSEPALDLAA
jgi:transcription elongation factor Elf1